MPLEEWFLNPQGLLALLALIPLFILYLIRPKPKKKTIPSLMFLLKDKGKHRRNALLQYLLRQLLLILQALIIISLAAAVAQPYLDVPATQLLSESVIILDDSASMHMQNGEQHRWQQAAALAKEHLGRENTLILAGTTPRIPVAGDDADETEAYLENWRPSHQPTRLAPAIRTAQDHLGSDTHVVIISDYADTDVDEDYENAIQTLRARGATVDLLQVGTNEQPANAGIVDLDVSEEETTVTVRNYDDAQTRTLCAGETCKELDLGPQSTDSWTFSTPPGITDLRLEGRDGFAVDDDATISTATRNEFDVLVVTNQEFTDTFLYHALTAIQETTPLTFNIEVNKPPQLVDVNHDLVIYKDVDPELIVSRTVRQTIGAVADGSAAIITYQDDLWSVGLEELLPLGYDAPGQDTPVINTENSEDFVGIEYGTTPRHAKVTPQKDLQVLARSQAEEPLIALYSLGTGRIAYYGLPAEASFSTDPYYAVFWKRLVNELTGRTGVDDLNYPTGTVIAEQRITTPAGETRSGSVLLAQEGIYESSRGAIAANLLDARESDPRVPPIVSAGEEQSLLRESRTREKDVSSWALIAALALLFVELAYLKWRGDA